MCDSGTHSYPLCLLQLDPGENIPSVSVCVCVCVFVCLCDTWKELGVAVVRPVDHSVWLLLTNCYVSFAEGCLGGHGVVMPTWLTVCYLSISLAKCTILYNSFTVFKTVSGQDFTLSDWYYQTSFTAIFSRYFSLCISKHNNSNLAMFLCVTYNHFKMLYLHLGHTYLAYSGLTLSIWCAFNGLMQFSVRLQMSCRFPESPPLNSKICLFSNFECTLCDCGSFSVWIALSPSPDEMSVTGLNSSMCAEHMLLKITSGCFTSTHICITSQKVAHFTILFTGHSTAGVNS